MHTGYITIIVVVTSSVISRRFCNVGNWRWGKSGTGKLWVKAGRGWGQIYALHEFSGYIATVHRATYVQQKALHVYDGDISIS